MALTLRETLNLLTQKTEKKFDMRIKRIKKTQPININSDDTIDVYCEYEGKTKSIYPTQVDSNGLIIGSDLDDEHIDSYYFSDLIGIEDKISILEMIDKNTKSYIKQH
jgi:hypothetical protein